MSDPSPTAPAATQGLPVIEVEKIFAGEKEIRLIFRGQEYRLRITRQGKLILTK